jgi:hypothetical protein
MTPTKDPSYFAYGVGPDGKLLWGNPEMHKFRVRSVPEYERLFAEAGDAVAIGEASTTFSSAASRLPASTGCCRRRASSAAFATPFGSGVLGLSDVPAQL